MPADKEISIIMDDTVTGKVSSSEKIATKSLRGRVQVNQCVNSSTLYSISVDHWCRE